MPKRRQADIDAAIATDVESLAMRENERVEDDPVMNTSVTLRTSSVNRLDRHILEKKISGDRGFSRSRIFQQLLDNYLNELGH